MLNRVRDETVDVSDPCQLQEDEVMEGVQITSHGLVQNSARKKIMNGSVC